MDRLEHASRHFAHLAVWDVAEDVAIEVNHATLPIRAFVSLGRT